MTDPTGRRFPRHAPPPRPAAPGTLPAAPTVQAARPGQQRNAGVFLPPPPVTWSSRPAASGTVQAKTGSAPAFRHAPPPPPSPRMRAIQRTTGNPQDYRFVHHTISPEFTQGATPGSKGENLNKVANDIARGNVNPMAFPPLPIFTIDDPAGIYGTETYSLSNRRLYVFKSAGVTSVNVRQATVQEILDSLWKMTSESGGYYHPNLTQFGDKNRQPGGLLGKFRAFCEKYRYMPTFQQMLINNYNLRFQ